MAVRGSPCRMASGIWRKGPKEGYLLPGATVSAPLPSPRPCRGASWNPSVTRSARGLFRAMGKASKPVHVRDLITGAIILSEDGLKREADDFYPTPEEPTAAILSSPESVRLREFPLLWEAAAGDGAMQRIMEAFGHKVHGSDLIDRGAGAEIRDFFDFTKADCPSPAILTNPPFDKVNWRDGKARWLYHALDDLAVDYMALLLPWPFPGAGGLGPFWDKHPPARVYLMRWKIDFTGQGAPPMLNAWFIWDKTWKGETALRMLDRIDSRQGELL